jgi:hypothetical protein
MTEHVHIRFHRQLNDFLPPGQQHVEFIHELKKPRSIKDLIESIGIPHTEVDIICIENRSVDFNHLIKRGETIAVYPYGAQADCLPIVHNQPPLDADPAFVLDVHLGRLAGYMRMMGLDTLYRNDYDDPTLADISRSSGRYLITCDRRLLMRKQVTHGYFMRARKPRQQLEELLARFNLYDYQTEDARCLLCNGIIRAVDKQDIVDQLQPLTKKHYQHFYQCSDCEQIYWEGSHFDHMQALKKDIRSR